MARATHVSLESVLGRLVTADLGPIKIARLENWQVILPKPQELPSRLRCRQAWREMLSGTER